jgi:hypothetical protein
LACGDQRRLSMENCRVFSGESALRSFSRSRVR